MAMYSNDNDNAQDYKDRTSKITKYTRQQNVTLVINSQQCQYYNLPTPGKILQALNHFTSTGRRKCLRPVFRIVSRELSSVIAGG